MGTTLLLVDDDVGARRAFSALLQQYGYRVVEAEDAFEALTTLKSLTPDVILSDYYMPGMNGAELLRELRKGFPEMANVPFLLYSGFIDHWTGGPEDPAPDVVIPKPVKIARLLAEISGALKRREQAGKPPVTPRVAFPEY